MSVIEEILKKFDLTYGDLSDAERETLTQWTSVLDGNQLDVSTVKSFISELRKSIEEQLSAIKETPQSWISIAALFIPFYGIIKKWYQDQYKLGLEMRLRNILLIEAFLIGPDKAKKALKRQIASIVSTRK